MYEAQAQTQVQAQEKESLWQAAGWRNLAIGAGLLTAVAIALPMLSSPGTPAAAPAPAPSVPIVAPAAAPAPTPQVIYVNQPAPQVIIKQVSVPATAQPTPSPAQSQAAAQPAPQPQAAPRPETVAQSQPQVCSLLAPSAPRPNGSGVVTRFEDQVEAMARVRSVQTQLGGNIDPQYLNQLRALVMITPTHGEYVIVPEGMNVQVGDRVSIQTLYRNNALPCNYVPPVVTADLGPAPKQTANGGIPVQVITH